ncbi:MAG: hypothetical protein AAF382_14395 [Pseudomonadota bacterium]
MTNPPNRNGLPFAIYLVLVLAIFFYGWWHGEFSTFWFAVLFPLGAWLVALSIRPIALGNSVGRVVFVLAPVSVTLGVVFYFLLLPRYGDVDNDLLRSLLTGLLIAVGWFVTFLASEYREEAQREMRRIDTLVALRAEISTFVFKLDSYDILDSAKRQQDLIRAGEVLGDGTTAEYMPFSIRESQPIVYGPVSSDIPILKSETVQAVIQFYAEYTDLLSAIEDTRNTLVMQLSRERRVKLHAVLSKRRERSLRSGLKAIAEIDKELPGSEPVQLSDRNRSIIEEQ